MDWLVEIKNKQEYKKPEVVELNTNLTNAGKATTFTTEQNKNFGIS